VPQKSSSKGGEVKVRVAREQGLIRFIFSIPGVGTSYVNLPDDISAGETVSGTVFAEPDGPKDALDKNLKALRKYAAEVNGETISAGRKIFRLTLPPASQPASITVRLLNDKGEAVAAENVAVRPQPPPRPEAVSFPPYAQSGQFLSVACPCDGVIDDGDVLKVGGEAILRVAESPRQTTALNTSLLAGLTQIEFVERGRVTKGNIRNIRLQMTVAKSALLKGEQTTMRAVVLGLDKLTEDLPFQLSNQTTNVLTMSGGDEQSFVIRPADVQGGAYTIERTLTGITVGAFSIRGVVRWSGPEESGAVGQQAGSAQSSQVFAAQWPRNSITPAEAGDALRRWQESLPEPQAPSNPPIEVRAVEPTPAMLSKLAAVINNERTDVATLSQHFDEHTFAGTVYSALLVHRYLVAEGERNRRAAGAQRETEWRETVAALGKAFASAGLPGVGEERLSRYAKQLVDNPENLKAVTKLAEGARMGEEVADDKAASAPLAQFVPATAKLTSPDVSNSVPNLCNSPLAQGSYSKHLGGSFPLTLRLRLPCWPRVWRMCTYTVSITLSYSFDLNVGYKVTCCGASAWGQAVAQACASALGVKVCAGCTGAVVGVAGLSKNPATGGNCAYGLGINASLKCTFGGATVFSGSNSWGYTVIAPCPPPNVPC
jgi:hypothetical protein